MITFRFFFFFSFEKEVRNSSVFHVTQTTNFLSHQIGREKKISSFTMEGSTAKNVRPDLPSKCTWHLGIDSTKSPHRHISYPV